MRSDRGARAGTILFSGLVFSVGLLWLIGYFLTYPQGDIIDGRTVHVLGDFWGFDIEAYVAAAARLQADGSLYARIQVDAPFIPGGYGFYQYAPPFGVAMLPLTGLSIGEAAAVWYFVKVAALLVACLIMPVKLPVRALTFTCMALSAWVLHDLILGNVSLFMLLPLAIAWRFLDRPLGSIAVAVAIAIRPSLGAILIWQLLRRRWRIAAWTIGAGLALMVLSLPFVGIDGYREYISILGNLQIPGAGSDNRDLGATIVGMGLDERWLAVLRLGGTALGLGLIVAGLRKDRETGYMIAVAASMLLVGLLWEHYLITLALPLALIADRWRPLVLLVVGVSYLPQAITPLVLLGVLLALFLVPDRRSAEPVLEPLEARRLPAPSP